MVFLEWSISYSISMFFDADWIKEESIFRSKKKKLSISFWVRLGNLAQLVENPN